jgi:sarcosine oxidase
VIAVVGAGIMGLATAWALARRGAEVVLLEQFDVDHRRGSSHGASRIFRLSYADAEWVALAQEAHGLWRELERESSTELLALGGLLDAVRDVDAYGEALAARGVAFERLTGAQAAERFAVTYDRGARLLLQPEAGIVRADRARAAFRDAALARGVELREWTPVEALEPANDGVAVHAGGELRADAVVVTAGGWVRQLVAPLGVEIPVTVTRETVAYFAVERGWTPPSVIDDLDEEQPGDSYYALSAPGVGLKAGVHRGGAPTDPADPDGVPDPALVDAAAGWVARRFPRARHEPLQAETCIYTNTTDQRFVLERHGRVVVGSPCSGHGFKFAPAIGERLATLALTAAAGPG